MTDPAADLVVYAARLVRHVRREPGVAASYRVLSLLDELGAAGISQLAAADGSSQPTMSAQVASMLADGLVLREPHPSDARASVITLSDEGRARLTENRRRIADAVRDRLAGYSDAEIATAVAVLKSLAEKGNQ